ncbi:Nicotianamine synthase [Corchorus capsularis]|uniref:Nicotianamine synthase n=1 Tax=Corchorus capsularis TaxID=210143 RepID=A0A1R3JTZ4_COCAP|nr:Nicotianamine synthase [Corchorus capsularis]
MASFQISNFESQIPAEIIVASIIQLHDSISKLESLRPSKQVNSLFTHLVKLCTLPSNIDIEALPQDIKDIREKLILLCGRAEGLLELEFATFLSKIPQPLNNLNLFPYYGNYVKLAGLEYRILSENGVVQPKKVAFVGSGPMPLTSFVMATHHMKSTHFDNYDIDEAANDVARKIVASDVEFEKRMQFVTRDIMEVREKLEEYDCIFLAALVGMSKEEKLKIVAHVRKYMKAGGFLHVRSAKGARAFLYPVVEEHDLRGFELISTFHPTNEVINSVVLVRKPIFQN